MDAVPVVDVNLLSLSSSASHRFDDDELIPKIDRSVFNESAGSFKQVYSRRRFVPRSTAAATSSVSNSKSALPRHLLSQPLDRERRQIISLPKQAFPSENQTDDVLLETTTPAPYRYLVSAGAGVISGVNSSLGKRKRGRPRKDSARRTRILTPRKDSYAKPEATVPVNSAALIAAAGVDSSLGKRKRGRSVIDKSEATVPVNSASISAAAVFSSPLGKRKRGRPLKDSFSKPEATVPVNSAALGKRTEGLEGEAKLLGLLESLEELQRDLLSSRDKRKIEKASELGDLIPKLKNIMLSPGRDGGHKFIRKCPPDKEGTKNKPIDGDAIVESYDKKEDKPGGATNKEGTKNKPIDGDAIVENYDKEEEKPGGATDKTEEEIDFDLADEYVDDMYLFYKLEEDEKRVRHYLDSQPEISSLLRSQIVDQLIEIHRVCKLTPETFYLTVNIFDRYLSVKVVSKENIELVGISSMVIAAKYVEVEPWSLTVRKFPHLSLFEFKKRAIINMENEILEKLEWCLTVPTPYVFLAKYIKASVSPDDEMKNMVFFLAELGVMDYRTIIMYSPSKIVAAAVYAARCTLNRTPFWTATLKLHTGYSEEQLSLCARFLVALHSKAARVAKWAYQKYSKPELGAVAHLPPAKHL